MTTQLLSLSTPSVTNKEKGAGYHRIGDGLHTVIATFSNWSGLLEIQATLVLDPAETDWFTVITYGDDSTDYDSSVSQNTTGNFVWFRAIATTSSGSITQIRYTY